MMGYDEKEERMELTINPEFEKLLVPLTTEEYEGLEKSITAIGCMDSIKIWNGVILDGHNRYKVCSKKKVKFETTEMKLSEKEDAIDFIIKNQLARRNLTPEQRWYLIGKTHETEKHRRGNNELKPHNETLNKNRGRPAKKGDTAESVGQRFKTTRSQVQEHAQFTKAVDSIEENLGKEVKQEILSGKSKFSKKDIVVIGKKDAVGQKAIFEEAKKGKTKPKVVVDVEKNGDTILKFDTVIRKITNVIKTANCGLVTLSENMEAFEDCKVERRFLIDEIEGFVVKCSNIGIDVNDFVKEKSNETENDKHTLLEHEE